MELIDKAAIVAEIKDLIRTNEVYLSEPQTDEIRFQKVGAYSVLNDLLHFINTLEVKKMDPDELSEELRKAVRIYKPTGNFGWGTLYNIAWHFYELGLKTQKGE